MPHRVFTAQEQSQQVMTYGAGIAGGFLSQLGPDDILLYLSILAVLLRIGMDGITLIRRIRDKK